MSAIQFVPENYLDSADVELTTGTENIQFPLSNLHNDSPSVKFRSQENSVVIEVDLKTTRPVTTVALFGDPASPFGVTSGSVKTSVTNDFSAATPTPLEVFASQDMAFTTFSEQSHRYVELTLTGGGAYVEIGALVVGEMIRMEQQNLSINDFEYGYDDLSRVQQNRYGQSFIDSLPLVKTLMGSIEFANKTEQELLDDLFIEIGIKRPIFWQVDRDAAAINEGDSKLSVYGYLSIMPKWIASGGQHYTAELSIRQAI